MERSGISPFARSKFSARHLGSLKFLAIFFCCELNEHAHELPLQIRPPLPPVRVWVRLLLRWPIR